ncbi:uncharacterized protein Dvar_17650 [Desulfosarcina variabilis str. Montpellier]|uniref:hypothetical protein n=1 Tax=Desulfosarcina variabilis TaxID=2300 RepID=UPI003AFB3630
MEIVFSDIDHEDLVHCSELFVSAFKESPWNEDWDIKDAFERLKEKQVSRIYLITHRESASSMFYSSLSFEENPSIMVMGLQIDGR